MSKGTSVLGLMAGVGASVLFAWCSMKIGVAIGLSGFVASLAGGGIIVGGIFAAVVVGIALVMLGAVIKYGIERGVEAYRIRKANAHSAQSAQTTNSSTKSINQELKTETAPAMTQSVPAAGEHKAEEKKSGGICGFFARLFGKREAPAEIPKAADEKVFSPRY